MAAKNATNEELHNDVEYDLIIGNGRLIDPANGLDLDKAFVAVKDGAIAAVVTQGGYDTRIGRTDLKKITKSGNLKTRSLFSKEIIDVCGAYIIPGIIDIHTHVYPLLPLAGPGQLLSVNADDTMLRSGITTTADAGTVGWRDFLYFKERVIDASKVRVLAFVNVAAKGMVEMSSEQDPSQMHPEIAAEVAMKYRGDVVGIKAAHYWVGKPFDDAHPPWASVDAGLRAAELCGMPFMIDFCPNYEPPGRTYEDLVLKKLRPGDIHTHVFAKQFPIVGDDGKVLPHMWQARERGVFFDVGHGAGSFWFRNGQRALDDGFAPDTLSTDMHVSSVQFAALDQLQVMSKFLNMGMGIEEVVKRSTSEPARLIRRPDLGTLSVGACADVAVIQELEGDFGYVDCGMAKMRGGSRLDCMATIRAGKVLFDPNGLSLPDWRKAPADYWKMPFLPPNK